MKMKTAVIGILLIFIVATTASAGDEYKKHKGYVDFETMGVFGEVESTIEVFLKGPLLSLVSQATRHEDPELSDTISKLEFIHVQTFSLEDVDVSRVEKKVADVAKRLEREGWEIVVRVRDRDEDEHVYVYLLPTKDNQVISGLVVMVVDDDDEAVFINIVGEIDPVQIGKLGRNFNIDELKDIDWDEELDKD